MAGKKVAAGSGIGSGSYTVINKKKADKKAKAATEKK